MPPLEAEPAANPTARSPATAAEALRGVMQTTAAISHHCAARRGRNNLTKRRHTILQGMRHGASLRLNYAVERFDQARDFGLSVVMHHGGADNAAVGFQAEIPDTARGIEITTADGDFERL